MSVREEKAKLDYSHRLEMRRMLIDKLLIGALIVLTGLIANMVVEGYKSEMTKSQFLLDKRLTALKEMRVVYSRLTKHANDLIYSTKPDARPEFLKEYSKDVVAFIDIGNAWGFLFSERFNNDVNRYLWIHEAAASAQITITKEHEEFVDAISAAFDLSTKTALTVEVFGSPEPPQAGYFHVNEWAPDRIHKDGLDKFFLENFAKWKAEKQRTNIVPPVSRPSAGGNTKPH
jgi:hypothetical protein